jgi:hypothetical protein
MRASVRQLVNRVARLRAHHKKWSGAENPILRFASDPVRYAAEHLERSMWQRQAEIARLLLEPPYRVLCLAGHNVGKTWLAACLVNWFYDTRPHGACVTTAPTARQVQDLLWREVRLQRRGQGFRGKTACLLQDAPDHYATGFTAESGEAFQGRHQEDMLFVFDEAVGVPPIFWDTTRSMFASSGRHHWLCICNPTDTTSQAYLESLSTDDRDENRWHVVNMSALDHPNILAELAGDRPPFPSAVRLTQVNDWVQDWCEPVDAEEVLLTDIQWPPESGHWWRPGPIAEARILGRWPSAGTYGVWSDSLFAACEKAVGHIILTAIPQIGCDVARYGDDFTSIHVRWGIASVHHESHNGWSVPKIFSRLRELAAHYAVECTGQRPKDAEPIKAVEIPIKVDDDGVGGGLTDLLWAEGYRGIAVNAGSTPERPDDYPNKRSELWFQTAQKARNGLVCLGTMPQAVKRRLRQQAMAPEWKADGAGRRVVEKKEETKEKIQRSPDDMDALNLAYYDCDGSRPEFVGAERKQWRRMG